MNAAREAWFEAQAELDPDRLVFLDETAEANNMAWRSGWAPRGERCRLAAPLRHYKTTTITAALRTSELCATALLDGPTNGMRFRSYVTETLIPDLQPATSSSWTTCQSTRSPACKTRSRPQERGCSIFRPKALSLTRSSRPSQN